MTSAAGSGAARESRAPGCAAGRTGERAWEARESSVTGATKLRSREGVVTRVLTA